VGKLGDVLEAMHDAPRAVSFRGRARRGYDPEKMRESFERLNRRRGGRSQSVAILSAAGAGVAPPSGFQESAVEFWYSAGRWRLDDGATRLIGAGREVFRFLPGMGGVVTTVDEQPSGLFEGFGAYFAPAPLLGSLRFRLVDEVVQRGRPCWHVATELIETQHPTFVPLLHGGEDFEFWVDHALGIILRCEGRLDGERASMFEIDELVVGEAIEPEVFAFVTPDGSPVRSQGEMHLERLRAQGVDVSGIDPSDPDQVQQAMQANVPALVRPPDLEQLAAQHIATGPPPEDEESARIDVGAAFQRMGELGEDETGLPNVERGENLGPCAVEIRRRFPQFASGDTQMAIERIKFLNPTEAVVWFRTVMPTREGRAVLVDGRWKVSRATYCSLVAMAGVTCPPPLARS
jgi:hypothetical protein